MNEDGLHPFETIMRLCAAAAPEPWYPRLFTKQEGVDRQALGRCLEEMWLSGLIERTDGGPEKGPAITLTREGQRVLLDPEALRRLRAGEPLSSSDRAAVIRRALRGKMLPAITLVLLALNILVFVVGYSRAGKVGAENAFLQGAPVSPQLREVLDSSGALTPEHVIEGQWRRLLTAGFVHIGLLHLAMNMTCLFVGGRFIEQMWGHFRYLLIYLAGVLGGSCLGIAHNVTLLAGASGAICGLMAAEAVWFLFNRRYLPRSLLRQARTVFLVNFVLLIFISSFRNVSGWGHFGGAAAGALTAMLLQLHRFGPPIWRWLAILGFLPMIWYGHYALLRARLTNPTWQEVEKGYIKDHISPTIRRVTRKAREVYQEDVEPLLEMHPTRRDAAKVEAALPILGEQQRELSALAEQLDRAGPYVSRQAEEARQVGQDYVRSMAEWFAFAEHLLQLGDKRTDKDRHALRKHEETVEDLREQWEDLFK